MRSRTSGLRVNAITDAVRNRNRTCPSVLARRNTSRSSTGRPTSWIQRGIRIVVLRHVAIVALPPARVAARESSLHLRYRAAMASPRSRQAARFRERRRRAQRRARRLVVLLRARRPRPRHRAPHRVRVRRVARDGTDRRSRRRRPRAAAVRPQPQVLASVGNLNIQLPVAAAALTAIGFHGSNDGSLSLQPVGRQANEGLLARLWRSIAGARRESPRWYQLEGGPRGHERPRCRHRARHRRLRAGRRLRHRRAAISW